MGVLGRTHYEVVCSTGHWLHFSGSKLYRTWQSRCDMPILFPVPPSAFSLSIRWSGHCRFYTAWHTLYNALGRLGHGWQIFGRQIIIQNIFDARANEVDAFFYGERLSTADQHYHDANRRWVAMWKSIKRVSSTPQLTSISLDLINYLLTDAEMYAVLVCSFQLLASLAQDVKWRTLVLAI